MADDSGRTRPRREYPPPDAAHASDDDRLFIEGDALYTSMLAAIGAARGRVWMESYIFAEDEIGLEFAEALIERAQAGVDVRLHVDAAGSLFLASRKFMRSMRRRGVQVRWFHRWDWRHPWRYNRRNHRKLLVVDAERAYLGGFNVHRENSLQIYGEERWRDSHICVRSPELVARAQTLFEDFWAGRRQRRERRPSAPHTTAPELVTNAVRGGSRRLRALYQALFHLARERLYVTTPYFVPDRRTQRALVAAARRGVDVRLLVPAKSDVALARWAARAAYAPLLEGGVKIYEYLPRVLHAKTVVIDGYWSLIGTANVDYRSFFLNYELVLFSPRLDLCRNLESQFHADLHEAVAISARLWPERAWLGRLAELIGWFARRLL